jgi:molybdopterin-containing oxidoreductase family iron-sulfur binding subunit
VDENLIREDKPRPWRSLEERDEVPGRDEFEPGALDPGVPTASGISRRNFMALVGATTAVAATVACGKSGKSSVVPYTKRPREIVPGVANYYASTFPEGTRSYAVLVKTREGRPIHVTGNDEHPSLKGKTSPRALADILRLYDPDRLRGPKLQGRPVSWPDAEKVLTSVVAGANQTKQPVLLLTAASPSPTRRALLAELQRAIPTLEHLAWEPAQAESAQKASLAAFGRPLTFKPRLEKAKVILSLGADFLNGEDPEAIGAFTAPRRPLEPIATMNRLWVFEGPLSLTGTNADQRFPVPPSRLAALGFALAKDLGLPLPAGVQLPAFAAPEELPAEAWKKLVEDLRAARSEAVVLCGEAMPAEAHMAAHLLNTLLGSQGLEPRATATLATLAELEAARKGMVSGKYAAVVLWGVNPVHAFPDVDAWNQAFARVPSRTWIGLMEDESSAACTLVLPEHHWLEAWGDYEDGTLLTLQQPTVGALYDTRQGEDILLSLLRNLGATSTEDYHTYLHDRWSREVHQGPVPFERYWEAALHDGLVDTGAKPLPFSPLDSAAVNTFAGQVPNLASGFELLLRPGTQVFDGRYGNNGWLQELPDPITKATWGNPLSMAVADAKALNLQDGDVVDLDVAGRKLSLPVLLQPGQAKGVLALALGYGRTVGGVAKGVGVNTFPWLDPQSACPNLRSGVKVAKGRGRQPIPFTQNHHRMDGRDLVHTFSLFEFAKVKQRPEPDLATLYPDQTFPEHKWGMAIDLSACIGCSACVLACQSENNVATVGPEQVAKGREMHWIRIDRYYVGGEDNPRVVHQPMLCQQCDSAPCENVCPVNATNHSPDGLNQMAYNRCVGTRYCANNCPYKVRRFNFLEYMNDKHEPQSLVYNPEVTVRPRGVMEKCTFCVQRIQDVRIRAKGEKRPIRDGEIVPACAAACPSQAIAFGDLKDPKSLVAQLAKAKRGYKVLEEVGARPAITYLADLKNPAVEVGE